MPEPSTFSNTLIGMQREIDDLKRRLQANIPRGAGGGGATDWALPFIVVAPDGSGDYTNLTDALNAYTTGAHIYIKNGTYQKNGEIVPNISTDAPFYIEGATKEGVILETTSASGAVFHAKGKIFLKNLTLKGSGWGNANSGLFMDADEANACTNSDFEDLLITECREGYLGYDNVWNVHFKRVMPFKCKIGFKATVDSEASYAGINASFDRCWVPDLFGNVDYGFWLKKTNAIKILSCEVLSPVYDGCFIGESLGDGWDIFSGSAFDNCGRHGLNVGAEGSGGFIDLSACWFKGGLTDANGYAVNAVNTHSICVMGGVYICYPNGGSGTHHIFNLNTCHYTRITGPRLIGHPNTLGDAIRVTNSTYCNFSDFFANDVIYVLQETGSSNYNNATDFSFGGIDAPATPVVLVGAQSTYDYNDITHANARHVNGEFYVGGSIYVLGTDYKIGASSKRFAVYDAGSNVLSIGYDTDFSGIELKGGYIKATGGYLIGAHAAADGTAGVTQTVVAGGVTFVFKNGVLVSSY